MPGFSAVGFECRLAAGAAQLDLQLGARSDERAVVGRSLMRLIQHNGPTPAWDRVRRLCDEWADADSSLHSEITELWCELDIVDPTRVTAGLADVVPSVFASIASSGSASVTICDRILEHLVGEPRSAMRKALDACASACPPGARVSHVGVMLGRSNPGLRVHVSDVPLGAMPTFLSDVGWSGDVHRAQALARILLDFGDTAVLCLDILDEILPRLAIECFFDQKTGVDPRWRPLLKKLVEMGLATPEKTQALLRWPGTVTPADGRSAWPDGLIVRSLAQPGSQLGVVDRRLSHVKLTFGANEPTTAKAYFGAGHVWWRPGTTAGPKPARSLRPAASVDDAVDAALLFLLAARNQAGWWRDFFDRARPADVDRRIAGYASDEWVTAYVAAAIVTADRGAARDAAEQAFELLMARRDGGPWGYHGLLPADADTTTWVLRLAAALDAPSTPQLRAARAFVEGLIGPTGGVATYAADAAEPLAKFLAMPDSYEGWCSPHACVTAAVAVLDVGQATIAYLAAAQRPDGSWAGHWWDDDEYTTLRTIEAFDRLATHRPAVVRGARWAASRIGNDGSTQPGEPSASSPFAVALALNSILVAGVDRDAASASAAARATAWLLANQLENGSWAPSARLRVPAPAQRDPLADPATTLTYVDDEALFTTATVLAALAQVGAR